MIVDAIIVVLAIGAAFGGWRRGAVVQVLSIIGFFVGLGLGALLVVLIAPHIGGQVLKTSVSLFVLLATASLISGFSMLAGERLGRFVRRFGLGMADSVVGASVSIAAVLVVSWLFASILVNITNPTISNQIEQSRIIRQAQRLMPPIPDTFATVQRYLTAGGFPEVLVNVLPESTGPVSVPNDKQLDSGTRIGSPATVKILAIGCGDQQEGSGFVAKTSPQSTLIVTNAHVVAGTSTIEVQAQNGTEASATVISFDPKFDLAILKTAPLHITPLAIDPSFVERGTGAIELGYPEDGPLTADKAGVMSRFDAEGRDIYDQSLTIRTVYELQADVRPGNSGGPLISPNGTVEGVVFSRSVSLKNVGFALSSPGVLQRLDAAISSAQTPVSTQGCIN